MTLRVACSALGKRIYAGHPTKDGTRFREPRHDVTSDVLKAVIDKIKIGNEVEVSDGESIVARIAVLPPVTTPARAEAQDEDTPCTDCGDTGVTHQTERRCSCQEAEAQDEGAAGEPVAWLTRGMNGRGDWMPWSVCTEKRAAQWKEDPSFRNGRRQVIQVGKVAHPSPTPAADADRVRIAVEALERIERISFADSEEETVARQALAALQQDALSAAPGEAVE